MKTLDDLIAERSEIKAAIAQLLADDASAMLRGVDAQHGEEIQALRYRMDVNEAAANALRRASAMIVADDQ